MSIVEQIKTSVNEVKSNVAALDTRVTDLENDMDNIETSVSPTAPATPAMIEVRVTFMGQNEGSFTAKTGTTIAEILKQIGGGMEECKTAKLEDRVVSVDTPLTANTTVEPTQQGGKVG